MARFTRLEVLNTIIGTGLVPMFNHPQIDVVKNIVQACADGGARIIEFTNRGDRAYQVFLQLGEFCERELPDVILGAGSIVDAPTAAMFISAGANFIVGPIMNPEIARLCNRRKIPYIPGCATVTEISAAEELGVEIVKLFPAGSIGGPEFVKAILAPCPWTSILIMGGLQPTRECLEPWFKAGVKCVGMSSNLLQTQLIAAGNFKSIAENVRKAIGLIAEIRQSK